MNTSGDLRLEQLEEKQFEDKPWVKELLEATIEVVRQGVLNWSNIICKIGEDEVNVDQYSEIFKDQISKLIHEMVEDVDCLQIKSLDRIEKLLQELGALCKELNMDIPTLPDHEKLPLSELRKALTHKIDELESSAGARRQEIKELSQKQFQLCQRLGQAPIPIVESPLPKPQEVEYLRTMIDNLETEAMERDERFFQFRDEILEMANNYKILPTLDFERDILELGPTDVRITSADMKQLKIYRDKLRAQAQQIHEEISELRLKVDDLWTKLEINIAERDAFINANSRNDTDTLEAFRREVNRLDQLKRTNLQMFIAKQREELKVLWKQCHCSEEDISAFSFFEHDAYTEDLFELHDLEIKAWQTYYANNAHIFELLEEHQNLWQQQLGLERKAGGTDRYKNRGGQLLIEEKARNRLKKKIPMIEGQLLEMAESFLSHNGKPFFTFGKTIQHYLNELHEEADKLFKLKLSAKKMEREQSTLTRSAKKNLFSASKTPAAATSTLRTQNAKRKLLPTPSTEPSKKVVKVSSQKQTANTVKLPKFNTSKKRRSSGRVAKKKLSFSSRNKENEGNVSSTDYEEFEQVVSKNTKWRSTTFALAEQDPNQTLQSRPVFNCVVTTPSNTEKVLIPREGTFVFKTPLRKK